MSDHTQKIKAAQDRLETVQSRFLRLLEEIPDPDWDRKIPGEGWTIKQQMVHIVQALEVLPAGIARASQGGDSGAIKHRVNHIMSTQAGTYYRKTRPRYGDIGYDLPAAALSQIIITQSRQPIVNRIIADI